MKRLKIVFASSMSTENIKQRKYWINSETGISNLLFVIFLAFIATVIIATIQSRLLLAIQRNKSSSDILIATYRAEAETNDLLAQFYGGYISNLVQNRSDNVDGTNYTVAGEAQDDGSEKVVIGARRPYAVSNLELVKRDISDSLYERVEITLALDCTSSMDDPADPAVPTGPTSFDAEAAAAKNFIASIKAMPSPPVPFHLGIIVFGVDAQWLKYHPGQPDEQLVKPDNDTLTFDQITEAINDGIKSTKLLSPACGSIIDATSIGSAYGLAHQYFADKNLDIVKGIEIVITDGDPNSRMPYSDCPPADFAINQFCPAFPIDPNSNKNYCYDNNYLWTCYEKIPLPGPYKDDWFDPANYNFNQDAYDTCLPLGRDFLKCTLADTNRTYLDLDGNFFNGVRNPKVDAYAVTVFTAPPAEVVDIFKAYVTPNGYFNANKAAQLSSKLQDVLNSIINSFSEITIRRVVP